MNEFQKRLTELLINNNLTQLKLGNAIGISSTAINGYFNENYYPALDVCKKLAKYFDCSINYILGLSENKENKNTNTNDFFTNFNKLMKETKLSIKKTLENLQMSEHNYYRWRDGQIPKTVNLVEIAEYFNVSVDYLIGYTRLHKD